MLLPTSPSFAALVSASHEVITQADCWYDGTLIAGGLPLTAGRITINDTDGLRTRLTARIADAHTRLAPGLDTAAGVGCWGHELHLRTGIRLPGGNTELLSAGWFRIQAVTVDEHFAAAAATPGHTAEGGATLELDALDRWSQLDDYRFIAAEQPAAGSRCLAEIRRLAQGIVPLDQWPSFDDPVVPAGTVYTDSRTQAITKLATAAGVKVYLDRDGNLDIRPLTALDTYSLENPDWTLHGGPGGGLYGIRQTYSRDNMPNAVVARGEAEIGRAPLQALAVDDDPDSPTRWDGPYGRVPAFYSSPVLKNLAAVQSAADTRLKTLVAGRDRLIEVTGPPNPAVAPGLTSIRAVTPRLTYTGLCVGMTLPCGPAAAVYTIKVPQAGTTETGEVMPV